MKTNLNDYIKKSHIKAVEKFNDELKAWAMAPDHLDAIQNGEAEFNDDEEED